MFILVIFPCVGGSGLPIILENPLCNGTETSLADCPGITWGIVGSECTHENDAGVVCTDGQFSGLVGQG